MREQAAIITGQMPDLGELSPDIMALLRVAVVFDQVDELELMKYEGMAPNELTRRADAVLSGVDIESFKALGVMDAFVTRMQASGCCPSEQAQMLTGFKKTPNDIYEEDDGHGHQKPAEQGEYTTENIGTRQGLHDEQQEVIFAKSLPLLVVEYIDEYIENFHGSADITR
jgi:hypothetical protein